MKESRKVFKKAFKKCKRDNNEIKNRRQIDSLDNNDSKTYWKM